MDLFTSSPIAPPSGGSAPTPERKAAPYLFLGQTSSLCEVCYRVAPAKVVSEAGSVFYLKRCREHGVQKTLIADDLAYWKAQRDWVKPGDRPLAVQSRTEHGCPWDCGLCADHEQHSCLAILEINEACNLSCPVCFADSSPARATHLSLTEIEAMLDAVVASEGEPDLVQLSGGRADLAPAVLGRAGRRAPPADPPPDDQHQWADAGARAGLRRTAGGLRPWLRGLPAVRQPEARSPDGYPRGRPLTRPHRGASGAGEGGDIHHPGGHAEEGRQRRRDRRHRALRAEMAVRARCHVPADPGRRPQHRLRGQEPPHGADRGTPSGGRSPACSRWTT